MPWASGAGRCKVSAGETPGDSAPPGHPGLCILWEGERLCFGNCALVNNLERYENTEFICS